MDRWGAPEGGVRVAGTPAETVEKEGKLMGVQVRREREVGLSSSGVTSSSRISTPAGKLCNACTCPPLLNSSLPYP